MTPRESRRLELLDLMADYLLREGLRGASLRPLAAAAGTSSRMLLYYFADKDELIGATLKHMAETLMRLLDDSLVGAERLPFPELLPVIWEATRSPELKPHMTLWLELAALAARGEEPFLGIAGQICDGFMAWAGRRLQVDRPSDLVPFSALLLVTVDGLGLMEAAGRARTAEAALHGATSRGLRKGD